MTDEEVRRVVAEIVRIWGANGDLTEHLKRGRSLQELGTAKEFHDFVKKIGTPAEVDQRNADIRAMLEFMRRVQWVFASAKVVASWAAVVAAGWLAFKGFFSGVGK